MVQSAKWMPDKYHPDKEEERWYYVQIDLTTEHEQVMERS